MASSEYGSPHPLIMSSSSSSSSSLCFCPSPLIDSDPSVSQCSLLSLRTLDVTKHPEFSFVHLNWSIFYYETDGAIPIRGLCSVQDKTRE